MRLTITFIIILLAQGIWAQDLEIRATQHGFFIPLGEELPYDFSYRVSRKVGRKDYEILSEISIPQSKADYEQRIQRSYVVYEKLFKPNQTQIDRTWDVISDRKSANSLFFVSHILENLALGRAWQDSTVEVGTKYQYKIEKVTDGRIIPQWSTEQVTYQMPEMADLPQSVYQKHVFGEKGMMIQWLLFEQGGIAGFEVFRQDNLRGGYRKISVPVGYSKNLDSTFVHVNDTLAQRHEVYEYKLRPFDMFGNPGAFSEPLKISFFTTQDFPNLNSFKAIALDDRQIKLTWSLDYKPFLRSIMILRSMSFDTDFEVIAEVSPHDSAYIDVLPRSMENYYYRLKINGPEEMSISTASTFILYESDFVPEPPVEFAVRTADGGVELQWEDLQRNVFGYYVYRQEREEGFVQISQPILANEESVYHYFDRDSSLRGDRFYDYALKTISDSYVVSPFSDTLSARPGITVEIKPPQNLRGRTSDGNVYLFWDDLSLMEDNLFGYQLLRKKSFEDEFRSIHDSVLFAATNHYLDSTVEKGFTYDYAVKAFNFFGSESGLSNTVQFGFLLPLPSPPPSIRAQRSTSGIRIVWGEVFSGELSNYNVYRYSPGTEPALLSQVPAEKHDFLDEQVETGELYFYYITSTNAQEIEGRPSEQVSVRY